MLSPQKLTLPPFAPLPQPALEEDALSRPAGCWSEAIFAAPTDEDEDEDIEEDEDTLNGEDEDDEDDYEEDEDPTEVDDGIIIEDDDEDEDDEEDEEDDEDKEEDELEDDDGPDSFQKLRTVSNPPQLRRSPAADRR